MRGPEIGHSGDVVARGRPANNFWRDLKNCTVFWASQGPKNGRNASPVPCYPASQFHVGKNGRFPRLSEREKGAERGNSRRANMELETPPFTDPK